ncbi:hypothetical protein B0J14DRAFT_676740 [Halenospora varia]|nr:hypothetical protein B0J14DRAFT_676740 [Halenospora varia]
MSTQTQSSKRLSQTGPSSLKPLTLHAHHGGPNPYKIAICLEALSIPYNVKPRVPVLEDPNARVTAWESHSILSYLLRTYDLPPFPPPTLPKLLIHPATVGGLRYLDCGFAKYAESDDGIAELV